jgi:hypothetical protein
MSQPHFGASVRMRLTLPKMGTWNPPGLPQLPSSRAEGKNPGLEVFFISLERSWNVNVENGFAWAIWTSAAQILVERKGRESNWQFDSQPPKVENRPDPGVCKWSATHRWKALKESYKFASDLVPNRDNFGTPLWESREKERFGCRCGGVTQRILYGGTWWLPPSPGRGESSESKVARGLSQHQKGAEWVLTNLWLVLDAGPSN